MNELVIFIWTILAATFGFLLLYVLKKQKRKLGKLMMVFVLVMLAIVFLVSASTYWLAYPSIHLIWLDRFNFLALGAVTTWALYFRPWTVRNTSDYQLDSILPELLFLAGGGCLAAVLYVSTPQFIELVPYSKDLSKDLWDLPLLFLFPLLFIKTFDLVGHVPFWTLENPFLFTIEEEDIRNWPRRDLMQVNFSLKNSLEQEYDLFAWSTKPWIEAPKEVALGRVFRLMIQQRRQRTDLETIQDMGDEYDGQPSFWWAFKIKFQLFKPSTWARSKSYLNPDLSLKQNGILNGDLIEAKRVPGEGKKVEIDYGHVDDDDMGKTVIINR